MTVILVSFKNITFCISDSIPNRLFTQYLYMEKIIFIITSLYTIRYVQNHMTEFNLPKLKFLLTVQKVLPMVPVVSTENLKKYTYLMWLRIPNKGKYEYTQTFPFKKGENIYPVIPPY